MNYLDSLNEEQKKAVLATEGPVLIVAGAGAGKTKTLTYRILHLINSGVKPENILAITFTNKAAREMRERVMTLLNSKNAGGLPFVSTFHSFGVYVIKENAEKLGLQRHFTIFDKADSKKAIKEALNDLGLDPKDLPAQAGHLEKIQNIISREKGRGNSVKEYISGGAYDFVSDITKKVWQKYEETLKKEQALDFDDLLLKTLKLLEIKEIREKYQNRFKYIHIDEYQDTNKVQDDIVKFLAENHRNICAVGDTDQNIYSWRGAEIKNMLHFEKSYPETQTFFLEQNYRSTKNILDVANEIIKKNNYRIPKKLFTENAKGETVGLFEGRNETDEAHFIALKCKSLIDNGVEPEEIAVLYRANFQSRVLEEAFLSYSVPYQMLGTKFFERKEIKDMISFVRASLNKEALGDFKRIINIPARGIGKVTLEKILAGKENDLPENIRIKLKNFREMLLDFKKVLETEKPSTALKYIVEKSGIDKLYDTKNEEDMDRLENVMELVSLATKYNEYEPEKGIEMFLTDSALASDQDSLNENKNGVKLMTVHSAKGLEFDYVFVCGLEADLFPHKGFGEKRKGKEEAEEERRLFYVAVTRAGKKLFLTYANTRTIFGSLQVNVPSEFLNDIPEKYLERELYEGVEVKKPLFSIEF
jgi:DNA helicase-2/ATP-dependent DNA helicase PcrA